MQKFVWLLIACCNCLVLTAVPQKKGPVAKFSFNNGKDYDEINGHKVKEVGVHYSPDRFGNKNNALYFYGNSFSYLNLGSYKALKPKCGTIALWVNIEFENRSGKGREMNPFIITKNHEGDDFYEAYFIGYFPDTKKVHAISSQDSLDQMLMTGDTQFELHTWHHLAFCYDNSSAEFYIDGKLQNKIEKHFQTQFLETDSVVVGVTANKKNNRFLTGSIDDIEIYDHVLSSDEIYKLYTAPNPNRNHIILIWALSGIGLVVFILLLLFFIKYRIKIGLQKEKQQMELVNKSLENELRVQRALMNPHFIFNSLNSLQNFILTNATEDANEYLLKFSKLIRKILESNMSDTITLELEIELLERYLELEEMRFEERIRYTISVDPPIIPSAVVIPIMMLQPFVENAIWHGLLSKEGEKSLSISFSLYKTNYIRCVIEDNGIGRQEKENDDTEKRSLAILFIKQRLELLNKIHNLECSLSIEDKAERQGTRVIISLPILK